MKKAFLFDLDGTLLSMNQELFMKYYFGEFSKKMMPLGHDPKLIINGMVAGQQAMVKNDGSATNEIVFWETFEGLTHIKKESIEQDIITFYANEFLKAKEACAANPYSKKIITLLKEKGYRIICATNPLFPHLATHQRINWADLSVDDFDYVTTYENAHYCKPNPKYYQEVLQMNNLLAEDVIMIGNDIEEDGAAFKIGIEVIFVTDELIESDQTIEALFSGTLENIYHFLKENY